MRLAPARFALWTVVSGLFVAAVAGAVGTRTFELKTGDDLKGGDLQGVAIDSSGHVRAGMNLGSVQVSEATTIWSALALKDGSVLLGTGNEGKLLLVRGTAVSVAAETKALVVTSLVEAWGGTVVLGTMPEGEVMKWEGGKLTKFVKLAGAEHVWQVAYDSKTRSVFAATGPEGKLFRVDAQGTAQVYFDADEQHLMSVAVGPDGTIYAGASDKAKLYKLTGPGRASVLYDFARTEVRAIAVAKDGSVYAAANEIKSGSSIPSRASEKATAQPASKGTKTAGKGVLYRFAPDGAPEPLLEEDSEHFVSLALDANGRPHVGTGVEGRVYSVDDNHTEILVADTEERQVTALLLADKQYVAGSDPAVLHPVRGIGGADAVWTSKALDASLRAHFGRMTWLSVGTLELSTRTGNTSEPDDTWSPWSAALAQPGPVASPAARYIQVRARFSRDPNAVLREITIPFVTDNLRAVITEVSVEQESETKSSALASSGGPITKKPDTKVSLKWKVDNPDSDELRYRLEYQLVGTDTWFDLLPPKEKVQKPSYSWETADLPEGRYRVRVKASDEISNPPERVKKHELLSNVILVDNTAPTLTDLQVVGRRVRATAVDGVGPIARIEISVAGSDEWLPFFPRDGVFDEQREELDADVSTLAPQGRAILALRVYDKANNYVVSHVTLR